MGAPLPPSPPSPAEVDRILNENLVSEFPRLRGAPGVCLEPCPWPEVKRLVAENSLESLGRLGRSPAGIVVYRGFRKKMLGQYASMADYVQVSLMGYAAKAGPDGKQRAVEGTCKLEAPLWRENDFPYNLEPGVAHHNIWFPRPIPDAELAQEIRGRMQGRDFAFWVNPFPLASIPAVWHAHVVSKPLGGQ